MSQVSLELDEVARSSGSKDEDCGAWLPTFKAGQEAVVDESVARSRTPDDEVPTANDQEPCRVAPVLVEPSNTATLLDVAPTTGSRKLFHKLNSGYITIGMTIGLVLAILGFDQQTYSNRMTLMQTCLGLQNSGNPSGNSTVCSTALLRGLNKKRSLPQLVRSQPTPFYDSNGPYGSTGLTTDSPQPAWYESWQFGGLIIVIIIAISNLWRGKCRRSCHNHSFKNEYLSGEKNFIMSTGSISLTECHVSSDIPRQVPALYQSQLDESPETYIYQNLTRKCYRQEIYHPDRKSSHGTIVTEGSTGKRVQSLVLPWPLRRNRPYTKAILLKGERPRKAKSPYPDRTYATGTSMRGQASDDDDDGHGRLLRRSRANAVRGKHNLTY